MESVILNPMSDVKTFPPSSPLGRILSLAIGFVFFCLTPIVAIAQEGKTQEKQPAAETSKQSDPPTRPERSARAKKTNEQSSDQPPKPKANRPKPTLVLRGGTVHTMTGRGVIQNSVIVVGGEKILAVGGADMPVPKNVEVIDTSGLTITPGFIDARSKMWLSTSALGTGANDASLNVVDGMDPFAEDWREIVSKGVTAAYVQPARQGTAGGYGAVVATVPHDQQIKVIREYAALQASIGVGASNNRTRSQQYERTKKLLDGAKAYKKAWDDYRKQQEEQKKKTGKQSDKKSTAKPAEGQAQRRMPPGRSPSGRIPPGGGRRGLPTGGRGGAPAQQTASDKDEKDSSGGESEAEAKKEEEDKKPLKKPDVDQAKARLVEVLEGKIPLRLEINKADDFKYSQKLKNAFPELEIVYEGLSDLGSAASEFRNQGSPVILGPWLTNSPTAENAVSWGETLSEYAGSFAIATYGTESRDSKWLRLHANVAQGAGVDPESALRSITVEAARLLGVQEEIGSIARGKVADLAVFSGSPFSSISQVAMTICHGKVAYKRPLGSMTTVNSDRAAAGPGKMAGPPSGQHYRILAHHCLTKDGSFAPKTIEIRDGLVHSIADGIAENDSGLPSWELNDHYITPGILSPYAGLGLQSRSATRGPDASQLVVADSISTGFPTESELVESGLLTVLAAPSESNPLAGNASSLRLSSQHFIRDREAAAVFVMSARGRSESRFPSSLVGQIQLIRQSLAGTPLEDRLYIPESLLQQLQSARVAELKAIASGNKPVLIVANTDAEIAGALRLIEEHDLSAALVSPNQLKPFTERLKELNVTVIANPVRARDFEWYLSDLVAAAKDGVPVCFAGESATDLRLSASEMVAAGGSLESATKTLFFGPKLVFEDSDWEAGKPANIVVWTEHPVQLSARVQHVLIDGATHGHSSPLSFAHHED